MFYAVALILQKLAHPAPVPVDTYQVTTIRQLSDGTYITSDRKL